MSDRNLTLNIQAKMASGDPFAKMAEQARTASSRIGDILGSGDPFARLTNKATAAAGKVNSALAAINPEVKTAGDPFAHLTDNANAFMAAITGMTAKINQQMDQLGKAAEKTKEKMAKTVPDAHLLENYGRSADDAVKRLDRLQAKIAEITTGKGIAKETAIDLFGISRVDRDMARLAANMQANLRMLENRAIKLPIDGDPTPLLRQLRRAEGDARQLQGLMRSSLGAVQASGGRAVGGVSEASRGFMMLAAGNEPLEKLAQSAARIEGLWAIFRGGKDAIAGTVGALVNARKAMDAFTQAGQVNRQFSASAQAIRNALAGRGGTAAGQAAATAAGAGSAVSGNAGSAVAALARLTGSSAWAATAAGGASAGGGAAAVGTGFLTATIGTGFIASGLAAAVVGLASAAVLVDPRLQNVIANATKNIPILNRITGGYGIAMSEARVDRTLSNRQRGLILQRAEFEGQSAALPLQEQLRDLRERQAAARDMATGAGIHAQGSIAEQRYQRQVERYELTQRLAGSPGPVEGASERLAASRRRMTGAEQARELRDLRAELAALQAGPIRPGAREQYFDRLGGGFVAPFAGIAGGDFQAQQQERRLRIGAIQGRMEEVRTGRATVAGGAAYERAAQQLGPAAEREYARQRRRTAL